MPDEELEDFIQYLKKLFPGLKAVFLKSNPKEIANSGWRKNRNQYDFDVLVKNLSAYHKACRKLSKSNGDIFLNHKSLRAKIHKHFGKSSTENLNHLSAKREQ